MLVPPAASFQWHWAFNNRQAAFDNWQQDIGFYQVSWQKRWGNRSGSWMSESNLSLAFNLYILWARGSRFWKDYIWSQRMVSNQRQVRFRDLHWGSEEGAVGFPCFRRHQNSDHICGNRIRNSINCGSEIGIRVYSMSHVKPPLPQFCSLKANSLRPCNLLNILSFCIMRTSAES